MMLLAEMDRTHKKMMCWLTRMPMMDANNNTLASSIKPKWRLWIGYVFCLENPRVMFRGYFYANNTVLALRQ